MRYSAYSYNPENAFTANTDVLSTVEEQIKTDLGVASARIYAVDIRSANAFTVALSDETKLVATNIGGIYVVRFEGTITKMVFSANTTATMLWCGWGRE